MATWLTECEVRESGAINRDLSGLTLNVAFLNDIKQGSKKPEYIWKNWA